MMTTPAPHLPSSPPATGPTPPPGRPRAVDPVAELSGAGRRFDDVVALDDITLAVTPGSLVGLIGPSGAGKTTTVRLLTGGLRPTSGAVRLMGEDPTRLRSVTRERIGFMPQNVSLYDDLTVAENLDFVGSVYGMFRSRRRQRIRAILDWLELEDARSRRAVDLSGGMRRRLQLGCALIHDPELVFLDEPTSGIDPIVRQAIWTELRRLRDAGRTLIVTTQIVTEAEECDTVALIAAGRLVACASPEELRREAFGGEVVEVDTSGMIDAELLARLPGVDEARQLTSRRVVIITPDAASATPAVVSAVEATGVSVTSIQTHAAFVRRGLREARRAGRWLPRRGGADGSGFIRGRARQRAAGGRHGAATVRHRTRREGGGRLMRILKPPLRIFAVMGKEIVEVLRRPRALLSIVAGPVLILGLFGIGYMGQPPLRAELVIPPGIGLPTDPAGFSAIAGEQISIVGIAPDPAAGRAVLLSHGADLLVIVPPDAKERLAKGEQTVLDVDYDTVSPYRAFVARAAADAIVAGVNRAIIQEAAKEAADRATAAGQQVTVSPEVVAAPTRAEVVNLAPSAPDIVAFYGIMVLALIVQHTVITVSSLSMLHDRRRSMLDLFRISPIGSGEILAGKYAAFTLLGTVVALAVLAILVFAFRVPFLGGPGVVLGCLALLVVASIGIGTVVALLSDTDRQAIQVSLLILLASVFFSGLAIDLEQFSAPVRVIGALLPVTQAGTLLQQLLLRGAASDAWRMALLALMAGGLFVVGWATLRRQMVRPA